MAVSLETWLLYLGTLLVFFATPGPSHLLMLSVSLANGARRATATAAGDLSANALQMLAAGLGLGAVLLASETAFTVVKWAGVGYLVWMGVQKIRAAGRGAARDGPRATLGRLWLLGFLTSAANPKAV
ncbi:MAG: LysE family transporter, partial [Pseudomonadota bacterium]